VAKEIKRIKKLPVVAHLHSYEPICSITWFSHGFNGVCGKECSPWLSIQCKQETNIELAKIGLLNRFRAEAYWLLDFGKGPLDYYRWRRVMNSAINSIDFFIAVSRATRDIIVSHLPEVRDKIEVVYKPVAHRSWRYVSSFSDEPGDYMLYAGGANPVKGPHVLLNALKILLNEGINIRLYMTGVSNSWLEGLARRLGIEG
jgi:glycosyltransferase involved in cell wall biosynthesis